MAWLRPDSLSLLENHTEINMASYRCIDLCTLQYKKDRQKQTNKQRQKERSDRLIEVFCLLTDSAFALFDVVGGFLGLP